MSGRRGGRAAEWVTGAGVRGGRSGGPAGGGRAGSASVDGLHLGRFVDPAGVLRHVSPDAVLLREAGGVVDALAAYQEVLAADGRVMDRAAGRRYIRPCVRRRRRFGRWRCS